jgi:hypothetical protein
MRFLTELSNFVHQLEGTEDAASDLWTWLPSYKKAQDCLGDYAHNVKPLVKDIILEANHFISHKCGPTEEQLKDWQYVCPCQGDCPKNPNPERFRAKL